MLRVLVPRYWRGRSVGMAAQHTRAVGGIRVLQCAARVCMAVVEVLGRSIRRRLSQVVGQLRSHPVGVGRCVASTLHLRMRIGTIAPAVLDVRRVRRNWPEGVGEVVGSRTRGGVSIWRRPWSCNRQRWIHGGVVPTRLPHPTLGSKMCRRCCLIVLEMVGGSCAMNAGEPQADVLRWRKCRSVMSDSMAFLEACSALRGGGWCLAG